jgi:tripartite-type tricarboxylate transporter receptor subunit TctC
MRRIAWASIVLRASFAAWLALCASAFVGGQADVQPAERFYAGKTVRFIVTYQPGGTYDLYSRLFALHASKHIAGQPPVVVEYMPGAGGMTGTVYLFEQAARDGTVIGMAPRDLAVNQMLHPDAARYDARRFSWIGRIASYTGVIFVMSRTGVKSADDLRRIKVIAGSWGNTTDSYMTPVLLNAFAGTAFKVVTGYRGGPEVDLAIERGEADSRVASWTTLKTTRSEWLRDGKVVVPLQTGLERHPDLPQLPLIGDLATSEEGRRILEFMNSDSGIGWNVVAPPGVPADRIAVLREAFNATMRDPDFLADAAKRQLEIVPGGGEEMQKVIARTLATPPDAIARLQAVIGGGK